MEGLERYSKPNVHRAYNKCVDVIMKCRTEEQLKNAGRCLRNYERLVQNSYLYPALTKSFKRRTANDLRSLLRLKSKEYTDF